MINFKNKIVELESLEKHYDDLDDQYEKDKLEVYSILYLKSKTLKRDVLRNNVSNYESFDYVMKSILKDSSISKESILKLYDDPDIADLLFKYGIMKRESFVSFVFLINVIFAVLLACGISTIITYLFGHEFSIETFGIHFTIFLFIFVCVLFVNGSFITFDHFHFTKKEK